MQFVKKLVEVIKENILEMKIFRCDNYGDHIDNLRYICSKEEIYPEYTASETQIQNGKFERKCFSSENINYLDGLYAFYRRNTSKYMVKGSRL